MSKHSSEFKIKIVRKHLDAGIGIASLANEYNLSAGMLDFWVERYKAHGESAFFKKYSFYSAKFKLNALKYMHEHELTFTQTAAHFDLRGGAGVVSRWQRLYDEGGIKALEPRKKGRAKAMKLPSKKSLENFTPEEQELKILRREVEYLRAENAYLKKLDDLLREKEQSLKRKSKRKKK